MLRKKLTKDKIACSVVNLCWCALFICGGNDQTESAISFDTLIWLMKQYNINIFPNSKHFRFDDALSTLFEENGKHFRVKGNQISFDIYFSQIQNNSTITSLLHTFA